MAIIRSEKKGGAEQNFFLVHVYYIKIKVKISIKNLIIVLE